MHIKMKDTGPLLTEKRIRDFEAILGSSLPSDFRSFLLRFNGGLPIPCVGVDIDGLPGTSADVQVFFGLDDPVQSCDLQWNTSELAGRIRAGWCPIACDSGGNLYCLVVSGEETGAIYYLDLSPEMGAIWYGRPNPEDRCEYKVASSFSDFLEKLYV